MFVAKTCVLCHITWLPTHQALQKISTSAYVQVNIYEIDADFFLTIDCLIFSNWLKMIFSSHICFSFWLTKVTKKQDYYVIVCLFSIIFHFRFACLASQMENIIQKIMQPIFIFGNLVSQNKKWKMRWKAHMLPEFTQLMINLCKFV